MDKPFTYGINPLFEALKAGKRKCYRIITEEGKTNPRLQPIFEAARAQGVQIETLPRDVFQKKFKGIIHQGVIGYFAEKKTMALADLIKNAFSLSPRPTLALLDGIQDPHNLGALIRSAEALGVHGLILPDRRSAPLNETVAKCSSGAIENLPIAWITNLARTLEELKEAGFWIVGLDAQGAKFCHEFKFDMPTAVLIGGEEKGIRPLIKKTCDFSVAIPMQGRGESLNASAAGTVIFYEILRQKMALERAETT